MTVKDNPVVHFPFDSNNGTIWMNGSNLTDAPENSLTTGKVNYFLLRCQSFSLHSDNYAVHQNNRHGDIHGLSWQTCNQIMSSW